MGASCACTCREDPREASGPSAEDGLAASALGVIAMYTHDLTDVFSRLRDKRIRRPGLEQVQHGSYRGFFIIGRRS